MIRVPEPERMDLPSEAEAYAAADFSDVNQAFVERLLVLTQPRKTAVALDLGTGPADIPNRLTPLCPGWRIVAVDASYAMLRIAGTRCSKAVALVLADAKTLPFPDNSFNIVFSNSILHHINEVSLFWKELHRIAAQKCLIFLRDLFRPSSKEEAWTIVQKYSGNESQTLKEEFFRSLLAAYTPQEVRQQLQTAGLSDLVVDLASDRHMDIWGIIKK
ncbi:MAG TPA: class I SAM-dependent methyltransferase [Candidatus Hydrogenedentes bacterium]|nr:class I SAM-dependent methyltransferase [Candidatus Hydrogenedentota bacterium]HOL77821.1 class I SAM-dependent methyltransferase [Candidatus Hydrogenedentota bacterium]HPO86883.1 class I SAM-dependent methyltransferase [Candidatus Hydrogenedentota bacterium]